MARYWWGGRRPDEALEQGSLVAAAVTVDINRPPSHVLWGGAAWQQEAWAHYDTCPELHAAAAIYGAAFSRAKMIVVDVDPLTLELGEEPTKDPTATALVARLFNGPTGKSQAQAQIGVHLTVPGECWVLATDMLPDADAQPWRIISVSEVTKAGNAIQIQQLDGTQRSLDPEHELLFRLFKPHPKRAWEADSPSRALLPVFRELAGLSAQVTASIKSRLATGGVWILPQSAKLPVAIDDAGIEIPGAAQGAEAWIELLTNSIVTAIADPDSPSAVAPIVAMLPDDVYDKIKDPIRFVQDILTDAQAMRAAAQARIAVGMDMPPEKLTGTGDINHWGQWFISEEFVTGPLTAALALPADAFTTHYLRPGLRISGKNPNLFAIRFDVSEMIADANDDNAKWAYEAGILSEEATLSALHFDPARDAATVAERERKLVEALVARGNPQTLQELTSMIQILYPNFKLDPIVALPTDPAPLPAISAPAAPKAIAAPSTTDTQSPPPIPMSPPAPSGP